MKIKVRVLTIKGGFTIHKNDMRKIDRLLHLRKKFEIEYIYDKFMPK